MSGLMIFGLAMLAYLLFGVLAIFVILAHNFEISFREISTWMLFFIIWPFTLAAYMANDDEARRMAKVTLLKRP